MGDVLSIWLDRAGLTSAARSVQAVSRWPEFVGPAVAAHARALACRRGVLTVAVDSNVWATELSTHIPVVLERISSALGEGVVTDLRFVLDRAGRPGAAAARRAGDEGRGDVPWPDHRDLRAVELSEADQARVAALTTSAADPELAKASGNWLTATLKARRWLRQRLHGGSGAGRESA